MVDEGKKRCRTRTKVWIGRGELHCHLPAGWLTVSSGPRVVMMADNSLPTLTRTSVWLEAVPSISLITQDRVGSTKSLNIGPPVSAMRARAWADQHWTMGLALSWTRARRMLKLVRRCWDDPRLPTYLCRLPRAKLWPVLHLELSSGNQNYAEPFLL